MNVGLSLGVLVSVFVATVPAYAQDAGLGLDVESLLPPEVVPLDPTTASQMVQSQAQAREASMLSSQSVPGLGGMQALTPPSEMQSPQDFRKSMFDSLYNQNDLQPVNQPNQNLQVMQGQMGQMAPGMAQPQQPNFGMQNQQQQQQPPQQLGQSAWQGARGSSQEQTLSGGVQTPNRAGNSKFNGIKHVLGTATGFGGGLLVGGMMMRQGSSSPAAMLGLGLMGGSVLNYGMRNAFRGF